MNDYTTAGAIFFALALIVLAVAYRILKVVEARLEEMKGEVAASALLGRLTTTIHHDPTAVQWIKVAERPTVDALIDAQKFTGI